MASFMLTALLVLAIGTIIVRASDPELTMDFFVPPGMDMSTIDGKFFTFTGLEKGVIPPPTSGQFGVTKVFSDAFPALTGLGISGALLEFTPGSVNGPHTHPRASELLYVISGSLNVGLIDTTNKLYEQNITAGDFFVIPTGLVHYQINLDNKITSIAIAAFSSSSPGLVVIPDAVFESLIPTSVLTGSFGVSPSVIEELIAASA